MNRLIDPSTRAAAWNRARAGVAVVAPHARKPVMLLLLLAVVLSGMTSMGQRALGDGAVPADAVTNTHVKDFFLSQVDGINGTGQYASGSDGLVQTNDEMQYKVNFTPKRNITNPVIKLALPKGLEVTNITGECVNAAGEPALPQPGRDSSSTWVGITKDSWKALSAQTVTCRLSQSLYKDQPYIFPFVAKVRSEVPNATSLTGAQVQLLESSTLLATSNRLSVKVVSAPQFDVQIGGRQTSSSAGCGNAAYYATGSEGYLDGRPYYFIKCGIGITAPRSAIGTEPLTGKMSFDLDLGPDSIYYLVNGVKTSDLPAFKANGWAKYRPELEVTQGAFYSPYPTIGSEVSAYQAGNASRRTSQAITTQLVDDTTWRMTIDTADADLSGYTCPTMEASKVVESPTDRCFVGFYQLDLRVPYDAITDLGQEARAQAKAGDLTGWKTIDNATINYRLNVKNEISGTSLSGQQNATWSTDTSGRAGSADVRSIGSWSTGLAGFPGDTGNTPQAAWWPGAAVEGPPGSLQKDDGEGRIVEDQVAAYTVNHIQSFGGTTTQGIIADGSCTAFDPRLNLTIKPGSAYQRPTSGPGSKSSMIRASDTTAAGDINTHGVNRPVWLANYTIKETKQGGATVATAQDSAAGLMDIKIQYAAVPYDADPTKSGEVSACQASSGTTWYDDPAKVPGNDPEQMKKGVYTAPTAVRVLYVNLNLNNSLSYITMNMTMTRDAGVASGTALGVRQHYMYGADAKVSNTPASFPTKSVVTWDDAAPLLSIKPNYESIYNPGKIVSDVALGNTKSSKGEGGSHFGARIIAADIAPKVAIGIRPSGSADTVPFSNKTTTIAAGQTFQAQLTPQLVTPIVTNRSFNYRAEICLPKDVLMLTNTASVTPTAEFRKDGAKATTIDCAADSNVYRWDLGYLGTPHADLKTCTKLPADSSAIETSNLDLMQNTYGCRIVGSIPPITMTLSMSPVAPDGDLDLRANVQIIGTPVNKAKYQSLGISVLSAKTSGVTMDVLSSSLLDVNPFTDAPKPVQGGFVMGYFNRGLTGGGIVNGVEVAGVLPKNGQAGSAYNGTATFTGYQILEGVADKITITYSTQNVHVDTASGSIVTSTGAPATWVSKPADLSKVTAVRFVYDQPIKQDEQVQVAFTYDTAASRTGNTYEMQAVGMSETFAQRHVRTAAQTVKGGSIGDLVWADNNANGLQDLVQLKDMLDSEHGIGGVNVSITSLSTARGKNITPASTTTTDAGLRSELTGRYIFDNLPEGSYKITVTRPAGYTAFTSINLGSDPGSDSDVTSVGNTYTITLAKHQDLNSIDAGVLGKAELTLSRYGGQALSRDYAWAGGGYSMGLYAKNTGGLPLQEVKVTDQTTGRFKSVDQLEINPGAGVQTGKLTADAAKQKVSWDGELAKNETLALRSNFTMLDVKTVYDKVVGAKDQSYASVTAAATGSAAWAGGAADVYCTAPDGSGKIQVIDDNKLVPGVDMKTACSITQPVAYPYVTASLDFQDLGSSTASLDGKGKVWVETAGDDRFGPGEQIAGTATLTNLGNVPVRIQNPRFSLLSSTGATVKQFGTVGTEITAGGCGSGTALDVMAAGATCALSLTPQSVMDQAFVDAMTAGPGDGTFTGDLIYQVVGNPAKDNMLTLNTWQDQSARRTTYANYFFTEKQERYHREGGITLLGGGITDASGNGVLEPGEDLTATYTVLNTGNLTISNLLLNDGLDGTFSSETAWDGVLSPGESVVFTKTFASSATKDLTATATVTGTLPKTTDTFAPAVSSPKVTASIPLRSESGLDVKATLKDASGDGVLTAGEAYWYEVRATNTTTDTFTGVTLAATGTPALPAWTVLEPAGEAGPGVAELAPGQSVVWRTANGTNAAKASVATVPDHRFVVSAKGSDGSEVTSNTAGGTQKVYTGPVLAPAKAG